MVKDQLAPFIASKKTGVTKVLPQTPGMVDIARDRGRIAKLPGKRISAAGNVYWETRKNRSDKTGTKI